MGATGIIKSCYKCERRYPGCHSVCESYIQEKAKHDEAVRAYKASQRPVVHVGSFLGDEGLTKYHSGRRRRKKR